MAADKKRAVQIACCVFLIGTLLAAALAWRQAAFNRTVIEQQLATESQRLITQIGLRLQTYELGLRATRSVVQLLSPDLLNNENFRRFQMGHDINIEFPGARGFGFIRRVPVNEEASFLQAARAETNGQFALQQLSPHQDDRYVIQYIEPIENNALARGLDIASEPKRKTAANHAARTGTAILTAPISLLQSSRKDSRSFLLLLPIYQPGLPLNTPQQRLQATYGWTYAPLIIDEILANIDLQDHALALAITDVTDDEARVFFYSGLSDDEAPINEVLYQQTQAFHGRDWQITTVPHANFTQNLNLTSPLLQFLLGSLLSGLLAGMMANFWLNQQRERLRRTEQERNLQLFNAKLEEQVADRTRLAESAHHDLHTILDNLPSMIGYWDTSVRIRFANRAYHEWFGVPFGTLPGKHIRELVNDEMYERNQIYVDAVLKGIPQTFERSLPAPDGSGMRHALAYYLPDIIDNVVRGYYVLIHDVTELTENREKLSQLIRENEALLSTIKSRSIYSVTDHRGVIIDINDNFSEISGYSRQELLGHTHRMINSGYHPNDFWHDMWQSITHGTAWRGEICNRHKDGSLYWVDSIIAPFLGSSGQLEKIISIRTDITASKAAAQQLADNEAFLARAGRIAAIGAWRYDNATDELFWTRETKKLHDIDDSVKPNLRDAIEFCAPDKRDVLDACFRNALERGEGWDIELPCTTATGRAIWMRMIGEVEHNSQGQRLLQGVYQDITEMHARREANSTLKQEKAAAEAANAAKSQFLANMSHEIRTPLNAMIGLSYLLDKTRLDRHQKSLLTKIQVASDSLLGLINDVLDLSKIEAQQMVLDPVPFKLNDLLRDLRQLMTAHTESKHLDLIIHPAPGLPGHLRGDVTRIKQILVNLLNNAIKFTEQGHVKLSVWSIKTTQFECHLHFSVRDTGVGIPVESQQRLFKPFTQADASITRRFGGSGLGLSIVQRLTELMGGQLGFSSVEGVGSEFWVEFPLQLDLPEYAPEARRKENVEILLVCPDAALCQQAQRTTETLGWSITYVHTVEQAIAKMHQAGITGLGFSAVLADQALLVSCEHWYADNAHKPLYLRNGGRIPPPLWIVLGNSLTSAPRNSPADDETHADTLHSPVDLFNCVSLAARRRGGTALAILDATPLAISHIAWLPAIKVLVVDDSDLNREVASRILLREGAHVELAENGQKAIDYLSTTQELPALILMDIQMPVMDGIEATRLIKQMPALAGTPIIALTAGALVAERQRAIEAGMAAFVSKPLDPAALIRLLRKQIETTLKTFVPVGIPPIFNDSLAGEWPDLRSIEIPHAMRQFGNDLPLFKRILGSFLYQFDDLPQLDMAGLSRQARQLLAARLHKMRGSAALLGARTLANHCKALERALITEHANQTVIRDSFAAVVAAFLTLKHEAAPVLNEAEPCEAASALPASTAALRPTDRFAIHKLHQLLKQNDLHALAVFEPLTDALQQALGMDNFQSLRARIEQLDFAGALAVLEQHALV